MKNEIDQDCNVTMMSLDKEGIEYLSFLSGFEPGQLQLHRVRNFHVDRYVLYRSFANILATDCHHAIAFADLSAFQGATARQLGERYELGNRKFSCWL